MRAFFLLGLFLPVAASAQYALDIGLSTTGPDETYAEVSVAGTQSLGRYAFVASRVAYTQALYDVSYLFDPEMGPLPSHADHALSLGIVAGPSFSLGDMTFRAGIGPVLVDTEQTLGPDLREVGLTAEVGLLDLYPHPSVGLGLSGHVTSTRSYTWTGARLGARVRL